MFYGYVVGDFPSRQQPPHVQQWQAVLNAHWPTNPERFGNREPGVRVRVRLVWERDSEEYLRGTATRWGADHMYVELDDHAGRLGTTGVWLKPADVYRQPDV